MEPEQDCSEWSSDDESDESLCEEVIDDDRILETILVPCVNVSVHKYINFAVHVDYDNNYLCTDPFSNTR